MTVEGVDGAVPGGHRAPAGSPPFPGGIGASHLRVYDSVAPDGQAGGTPHCHTACTEAYLVVAGSGRVATLSGEGYVETPIRAGSFVWFTPGTIHRLLNDGGDLEIVVLMQNAGLPEAGDMVITFDDAVLADPAAYAEAAALPEATTASDPDPARARRDRGVEGFVDLVGAGPGRARPVPRAGRRARPPPRRHVAIDLGGRPVGRGGGHRRASSTRWRGVTAPTSAGRRSTRSRPHPTSAAGAVAGRSGHTSRAS